jgi:hypothetical protein
LSAEAPAAWFAQPDSYIAGWEADAAGHELELARGIVNAGERHEVFRIVTVPVGGGKPEPFDYPAHLERGARPFALTPEEAPAGRRFATPGRICWEEPDGRLVDGEVADLGPLLMRLRPDAAPWAAELFMAYVPPVVVQPLSGAFNIVLRTDIWFPRILGVLDGNAPLPPAEPSRDNTRLARCHTPRLNAFLADVRETALALGGSWRPLPVEGLSRYASMTDAGGIVLQ